MLVILEVSAVMTTREWFAERGAPKIVTAPKTTIIYLLHISVSEIYRMRGSGWSTVTVLGMHFLFSKSRFTFFSSSFSFKELAKNSLLNCFG